MISAERRFKFPHFGYFGNQSSLWNYNFQKSEKGPYEEYSSEVWVKFTLLFWRCRFYGQQTDDCRIVHLCYRSCELNKRTYLDSES